MFVSDLLWILRILFTWLVLWIWVALHLLLNLWFQLSAYCLINYFHHLLLQHSSNNWKFETTLPYLDNVWLYLLCPERSERLVGQLTFQNPAFRDIVGGWYDLCIVFLHFFKYLFQFFLANVYFLLLLGLLFFLVSNMDDWSIVNYWTFY